MRSSHHCSRLPRHADALRSVEIPPPAAIDYYGMVDGTGPQAPRSGDTVVFGFRGQAFVTRAYAVGIAGVSIGNPRVVSIENIFGQPEPWPHLRKATS